MLYLDRVSPFIGNRNAKVFVGIRRCGKSTLMDMTAERILAADPDANIIRINMEFMDSAPLRDVRAFYDYVKGRLAAGRRNCLFVDEIQDIGDWEKAIRSLIAEDCCDIYISGSNSHMLSGEYSTYLSGRLNTISVQPLTYRECLMFRERYEGDEDVFGEYLRRGGFPLIWTMNLSDESAMSALSDIHSTVVLKDIIKRHDIRSTGTLDRLVLFLCDNVGKSTSPFNIYNKMHSEGDPIGKDTLYSYIDHLEEACFIRKTKRYDLKGKRLLESEYKYYLTDLGLKYAVMGFRKDDISGHIENVLFNELTTRGYDVSIGKLGGNEIDFIASKAGKRMYIQATYLISSDAVVEREFGNLKRIDDGYPRYVIGMDPFWKSGDDVDGIVYRDLKEFLTADDW
ncbi:MAG: ATP-binding protein [Candidatus Methanoplasma sp.]|jgi:predicted AAA+ superfamily ATPase|nr:ATP-binding protein [Candidatus Methanoplasma sp.]